MKNLLYLIFAFFVLTGCGEKPKSQGTNEKSGDSKLKKSDSTQSQSSDDISKLDISTLPKFKMTFERENGVNIINSDLRNERFLYDGHDNLISPDGSKVVHTKSNQDGSRSIAIFDIESKTTKVLNSITGKQSFDAAFSPDGKTLVFCNFSGKKWNLAMINTDDTGFKILSESYKTDLFCPTFAPDGKSILCQDMQNFVEFDLKGNIIQTIPLKEVVGDGKIYFSSGNRPHFVNNKEEILFDADTEDFFETMREPISSIYLYSIKSKTLKILSGTNISSSNPFPLDDGKHILFSAFTKDDLTKSTNPQDSEPMIMNWIYIMNIDGTGKTKLVKDGYDPSASKPE